jgi:hypothetical protein
MRHAVEMGSGSKFNKDWFRHSKAIRRDTQTHRQEGDRNYTTVPQCRNVYVITRDTLLKRS